MRSNTPVRPPQFGSAMPRVRCASRSVTRARGLPGLRMVPVTAWLACVNGRCSTPEPWRPAPTRPAGSWCAAHPDMNVVGEAGSGAEAVDRARTLQPDIALVDVRMPGIDGIDGIEATRRITALGTHCRY